MADLKNKPLHSTDHSSHFLRVGLTGGIGSGKSAVATELEKCGAAIQNLCAARLLHGDFGTSDGEVEHDAAAASAIAVHGNLVGRSGNRGEGDAAVAVAVAEIIVAGHQGEV